MRTTKIDVQPRDFKNVDLKRMQDDTQTVIHHLQWDQPGIFRLPSSPQRQEDQSRANQDIKKEVVDTILAQYTDQFLGDVSNFEWQLEKKFLFKIGGALLESVVKNSPEIGMCHDITAPNFLVTDNILRVVDAHLKGADVYNCQDSDKTALCDSVVPHTPFYDLYDSKRYFLQAPSNKPVVICPLVAQIDFMESAAEKLQELSVSVEERPLSQQLFDGLKKYLSF